MILRRQSRGRDALESIAKLAWIKRMQHRCYRMILSAFAIAGLACTSSATEVEMRAPAWWVERIRAQAAAERIDEDFALLRLGTGVYITHGYSGGSTDADDYRFPDACHRMRAFMQSDGETILQRILEEQPLTEKQRPYHRLVTAVYLWAGFNRAGKRPARRFYELPLNESELEEAVRFHDRVVADGQSALRSGYLTGELTEEQVEAIRLYRIAQGMRGVGECFLPSHLGLHPSAPSDQPRSAGHGVPSVIRGNIGRRFFDVALPRLDAVWERHDYTDLPDYRYGYEFPLREEGVLEFIEPMVGYASATNEAGLPIVSHRPRETTHEAGSETIGSLVGQRPVLLFMNDGVDAPFLRAISQVPVLMPAWQDHIQWRFIAVNIHDWHYAAGSYHDYFAQENWRTQHHAWSVDERARRFSMRLIQCPHVQVPALVDTPHHTVKDRYASGGGQNSFWLIDRGGTLVHRNGGPFRPLNEVNAMEHALSRLVSADGQGPLAQNTNPRTWNPSRPTVVLHGATLQAADKRQQLLNLSIELSGETIEFACQMSPETRIELDGRVAGCGALAPGDRLQVRCFLDQLADFTSDELPPPANPWEPNKAGTLRAAGGEMKVTRVHHGYEADYDLFVLVAAGQLPSIGPRWIRAWRAEAMPNDGTSSGALWPHRVTIWRGGRVQSIDAETRTVVVEPWEVRNDLPGGLQIIDRCEAAGQTLRLDEVARQRLACVRNWRIAEPSMQRFRLDDAVDFTLNGLFDATFADLRSGDAVTIRYDCRYDAAPEIRPEFVRISRPHD